MELSKTVKDKTFDDYFTEVKHSETINGMLHPGSLRFFCLNVRSGNIKTSDLEKFTMLNIGQYVFSRAKQENYKKAGNADVVTQQALRAMRKSAKARNIDAGETLGEIMVYAFLEEKLKAYKLLSKIELSTDAAQYASETDGIHFLCKDGDKILSNQMVFGASSVTGNIKDAIDIAFQKIEHIASHEDDELLIVEKIALDRFFEEDDLEVLTSCIIPEEHRNADYEISFGVFLGYSLGLNPDGYSDAQFRERMHRKMIRDISAHEEYIAEKIRSNNLQNHSFYFFTLPLNRAEKERSAIMQHVMEGDVDL
ncbi:DUF1837 domain-containing protein [Pseudoramibacter faecis]|uniref:HamA C-terminal domain-containing protein n=1 Tax=Pseudoramibacter faecis TaxID=3108534 RepID=UPI002E79F325|nr:DUF1837 domain-containing protein [Pseudoramibacter sp. HA2172]